MRPTALCSGLDVEMFVTYEERFTAANVCRQCDMKSKCLILAIKEHATGQTRGGMWIGAHGHPQRIGPKRPVRRNFVGIFADEWGMERRLAEVYGGWDRPTVPTRHEVWVIGERCQRNSYRWGVPCTDPICRILNQYQRRQRRAKTIERQQQQAA